MNNRWRKYVSPALLIFSLLMTVFAPIVAVKAEESRLESIIQAGGGDWGGPNPFLQDPRGPGSQRARYVFDSLLEDDEEGKIDWLAKEWEIDGDTYRFTIYEDATFHDGKPLTTEDIAFTIDYYREHPAANNLLGSKDNFAIADYEVIDDQTIEIIATESIATTEDILGSFLILPKHIWEKVDDPYTYHEEDAFIGSGLYKKGEYNATEGTYEFIANDDYYGRSPVADRLLFIPVSDPLLAFEEGQIDVTTVPADVLDNYTSRDDVVVMPMENRQGVKLIFNFDEIEALKDVEVRRALTQGIDFEAILEKIHRNQGSVPMSGHVPLTNWYYNPEIGPYEYNPEAAKAVLEDLDLELNVIAGSDSADISTLELVKTDLEPLGVTVNIEAIDRKTLDERVLNEDFEAAIVSHGGWDFPPDYLRTTYSEKSVRTTRLPLSMGPVGYSNDKMTELAEQQLKETDREARRELFFELQKEISEEIPLIILGTETQNIVFPKDGHQDWVKTINSTQVEQNRLSYAKRE